MSEAVVGMVSTEGSEDTCSWLEFYSVEREGGYWRCWQV